MVTELSTAVLDELLLFGTILIFHVLIVDEMRPLELELSRTPLNVLRMLRELRRLLNDTLVRIAVRALLKVLLFLRVIRKLVVRVCVVGALPIIVLLLLKRLVLLLNELVTLSCFIQLRRIELLKILLLLEVLVEAGQV